MEAPTEETATQETAPQSSAAASGVHLETTLPVEKFMSSSARAFSPLAQSMKFEDMSMTEDFGALAPQIVLDNGNGVVADQMCASPALESVTASPVEMLCVTDIQFG